VYCAIAPANICPVLPNAFARGTLTARIRFHRLTPALYHLCWVVWQRFSGSRCPLWKASTCNLSQHRAWECIYQPTRITTMSVRVHAFVQREPVATCAPFLGITNQLRHAVDRVGSIGFCFSIGLLLCHVAHQLALPRRGTCWMRRGLEDNLMSGRSGGTRACPRARSPDWPNSTCKMLTWIPHKFLIVRWKSLTPVVGPWFVCSPPF